MEKNYEKGKAIIFRRAKEAELREIRLAEVDEKTIVVKTKYSGISTGTEMAVYSGEANGDGVIYPCVPGYEAVGEVVYAGSKAFTSNTGEKFREGNRVMANEVRSYPDYNAAWGGQCEYAVKNPETSPYKGDLPAKIPDNVSYQEAVIAYLACVAKKGIDMVGINKGESVLIMGAGTVGLSALQLAKIYGAGNIIAGDIRENRLELAQKYTPCLLNLSDPDSENDLLDLNEGKKVDVVIECSGNPSAVDIIPDYIRPEGRVHLLGHYRRPVVITHYSKWNCNDLRISCSIAINPGSKEEILKMISEGKFDAKGLYTEEYFVDDAPKAYKELERNKYHVLKILLKWEK
ncbi:MAG: zinc-binding dehydrogenase [Candidatus Omnitrophica bacterium]|nr:zinc-binding dehydrogenase [Candidatus Omnitrophota bacterium]